MHHNYRKGSAIHTNCVPLGKTLVPFFFVFSVNREIEIILSLNAMINNNFIKYLNIILRSLFYKLFLEPHVQILDINL